MRRSRDQRSAATRTELPFGTHCSVCKITLAFTVTIGQCCRVSPSTRVKRLGWSTRTGLLSSAAAFCLLAPSFGARWSLNSNGPFLPAILASMAVACAVGWAVGSRRQNSSRKQILRGDVLFCAAFPLAVVAGVLFAGSDNGITGARDRLVWVVSGACVGGIVLLCAGQRTNSASTLRRFALGWAILAVLTWWIYGLGLVFVPLAAGYFLASTARETSA